jgi:site-specific DNA-cytosine methylase
MRVLVACEVSGRVRDAFRKRGHDAYSCDILKNDSPYHIRGDVRKIINNGWDLMIAHPPCTHLSVSGAAWFYKKEKEQKEALSFVSELMNADIPKIAVENPISIISTKIRKPDQIIQPYNFGDPHQKTTCLWLKNLPMLHYTANYYDWDALSYKRNVKPQIVTLKNGERMSKFHSDTFNLPKSERGRVRSITFQGIADAMAEQWGYSSDSA